MSKTRGYTEARLLEAIEAAKLAKKPNLSKIAREFGVNRRTLHNRVVNGTTAKNKQKPVNKVFTDIQEEILIHRITQLNKWHMPPTPKQVEMWANRLLQDSSYGDTEDIRTVGPNWVYRFSKRLPEGLKLVYHTQKVNDFKRISAEIPAEIVELLEPPLKNAGVSTLHHSKRAIRTRQATKESSLEKKSKKRAQNQTPEPIQEPTQEPIQGGNGQINVLAIMDRDILHFKKMLEQNSRL